jgi:hypothetical protein
MSDTPTKRPLLSFPQVRVSERDFIIVHALASLRLATAAVSQAMPGVPGVVENDELREIALRLAKTTAKIEFAMGTIDEDDLKLALESELPR